MAEGGSGSSQTNEPEDRSYVGVLAGRFLSQYDTWREEQHAPQTTQEYDARLRTGQTATCARIGALHYEMEKGLRLWKVTGIDSHVFEQKWLSPDDDRWLCFHANFTACFNPSDKDKDRLYFFTEVKGIKGPEFVTSCVRLSGSGYTVHNCRFCTGLWHPTGRNFLGRSR